MRIREIIAQRVSSLPESAQREALDFVELLDTRQGSLAADDEDEFWSRFSLASAMRGMEDEETPYTLDDVKESPQ